MAPETEILVHITAPSTSANDAYYRSLALAYQGFECCRRVDIPSRDVSAYQRPAASPPEDLISPQASFRSVWDNVRPPPHASAHSHSPSQQSGINRSQDGHPSQDSWVAPPSEVGDSMPDNDITLDEFTTPTRVLNYFLQTMGPPSESSQESTRENATTFYDGAGDFTSLLAQPHGATGLGENACVSPTPAVQQAPSDARRPVDVPWPTPRAQETTSATSLGETHVTQTPSSPLQSKGLPPPSHDVPSTAESRVGSSDQPQSDQEAEADVHEVVISSTQPPERPERPGSEPPASKRHKATHPLARDRGVCLGRSVSDVLPRGRRGTPSRTRTHTPTAQAPPDDATATGPGGPDAEQSLWDWRGVTEIVSVEPPPAGHKLGPRPPAQLEDLARTAGMAGRYRPRFQARATRPYERGYWLLDMDAAAGADPGLWPPAARVATWGFLGNYVRRDGRAGWGTRACRDEGWRWIRLYGWEHIAGELYMLLYMASYRRVKCMDVTWYDGAGEELITVGARGDKSILG